MKLFLGTISVFLPLFALSWSTAAPSLAQGSCDPSYPDVCIASPPPELSCSDIPYHSFRVVGADPHGFDRNGNGIGCEIILMPSNPNPNPEVLAMGSR